MTKRLVATASLSQSKIPNPIARPRSWNGRPQIAKDICRLFGKSRSCGVIMQTLWMIVGVWAHRLPIRARRVCQRTKSITIVHRENWI